MPAVQAGVVDAVIAGQSMTASRAEMVDFAGPYLYASIVCLAKQGTPQAAAKGISELSGYCTSQLGTIWYDSCLPQIAGAKIQSPAESAPAMLMALEAGMVDFICTDMPTAQGALLAYPDLVLLDFSGSEDNFVVSDEDINIGISVRAEGSPGQRAVYHDGGGLQRHHGAGHGHSAHRVSISMRAARLCAARPSERNEAHYEQICGPV